MGDNLSAGLHGFLDGAGGITDIGAKNLMAFSADGLFRLDPGNVFGGTVERGNPPVPVNGENPFRDGAEDAATEGRKRVFRIE